VTMVRALRRALAEPMGPVANAGLELDRYLAETVGGENAALNRLLNRVCDAAPPSIYRAAYERWRAMLEATTPAPAREIFTTGRGRLIVGLEAETVRETAITLLRLYGVPQIPGSALKGLARRYARYLAENDPAQLTADQVQVLFGDQTSASYLTF